MVEDTSDDSDGIDVDTAEVPTTDNVLNFGSFLPPNTSASDSGDNVIPTIERPEEPHEAPNSAAAPNDDDGGGGGGDFGFGALALAFLPILLLAA
jgi:hypothetical protein